MSNGAGCTQSTQLQLQRAPGTAGAAPVAGASAPGVTPQPVGGLLHAGVQLSSRHAHPALPTCVSSLAPSISSPVSRRGCSVCVALGCSVPDLEAFFCVPVRSVSSQSEGCWSKDAQIWLSGGKCSEADAFLAGTERGCSSPAQPQQQGQAGEVPAGSPQGQPVGFLHARSLWKVLGRPVQGFSLPSASDVNK